MLNKEAACIHYVPAEERERERERESPWNKMSVIYHARVGIRKTKSSGKAITIPRFEPNATPICLWQRIHVLLLTRCYLIRNAALACVIQNEAKTISDKHLQMQFCGIFESLSQKRACTRACAVCVCVCGGV